VVGAGSGVASAIVSLIETLLPSLFIAGFDCIIEPLGAWLFGPFVASATSYIFEFGRFCPQVPVFILASSTLLAVKMNFIVDKATSFIRRLAVPKRESRPGKR